MVIFSKLFKIALKTQYFTKSGDKVDTLPLKRNQVTTTEIESSYGSILMWVSMKYVKTKKYYLYIGIFTSLPIL